MNMNASSKKRENLPLIYTKFMNLRVRTKIIMLYLVLLVFSLIISSVLYQKVYFKIMLERVNNLSMETLYSIEQNVNTMLNNINVYSKLIISNDNIRGSLNNRKALAVTSIGKNMQGFMETVPMISSVYIINDYGDYYVFDREQSKELVVKDIKETQWYKEALKKNGGYVLSLNCGGSIIDKNNKNFISFIRIFYDMYSQEPLGTLILNIPEEEFANAYQTIMTNYDTSYTLLDENKQRIVSLTEAEELNIIDLVSTLESQNSSIHTRKINQTEYLISNLTMTRQNWHIISISPVSEMLQDSKQIYYISIFIFVINSLLLFLGSLFISSLITRPIKKLSQSMKKVEERKFEIEDVWTGNDEIGKLGAGYNIMISEIQNLIEEVVEEQRLKRKAELNVLQAQIKPHFLYNTFDSISYLALSGRTSDVYEIIKALGSFYRSSLSKGSEIITIKQEIETIRNYLIIQKICYGNLFTDTYVIDEAAEKCKIPKLILQPLVENALNHGIKPKGEDGTIAIGAKFLGDHIEVTVEDNGVGMNESQLDQIKNSTIDDINLGFGLRGTIERLKIYYDVPDLCQIISKYGEGTKIVIRIPLTGEYQNEQ